MVSMPIPNGTVKKKVKDITSRSSFQSSPLKARRNSRPYTTGITMYRMFLIFFFINGTGDLRY
jgi:hypothetical protein